MVGRLTVLVPREGAITQSSCAYGDLVRRFHRGLLVLHGLVEADGTVETLPRQSSGRALCCTEANAAAVSTYDVSLSLRVAEICLPYEGLLILLALFLRPYLLEVRHYVSDGLLVHGYALLQDVERPGEDRQLAHDFLEGLCQLLTCAGHTALVGIGHWLRFLQLGNSSSATASH